MEPTRKIDGTKTKTIIDKRYKITVCADGFVSIVEDMKKRRLKAALPCHSVDDIFVAFRLIEKVCHLAGCDHGGKTGSTVEPKAIGWPMYGSDDLQDLYDLAVKFQEAELFLSADEDLQKAGNDESRS